MTAVEEHARGHAGRSANRGGAVLQVNLGFVGVFHVLNGNAVVSSGFERDASSVRLGRRSHGVDHDLAVNRQPSLAVSHNREGVSVGGWHEKVALPLHREVIHGKVGRGRARERGGGPPVEADGSVEPR